MSPLAGEAAPLSQSRGPNNNIHPLMFTYPAPTADVNVTVYDSDFAAGACRVGGAGRTETRARAAWADSVRVRVMSKHHETQHSSLVDPALALDPRHLPSSSYALFHLVLPGSRCSRRPG